MDDETDTHLKSNLFPKWFGWVALGIVALWLAGPQIVAFWAKKTLVKAGSTDEVVTTTVGVFGDQFGAINTLFSGLAFLGVLVSIFIQGNEFRCQLKEMATNAKEMKTQSKIYDDQLQMLRRQNDLISEQLVNAQVQERLAAQPFLVIECSMQGNRLFIYNKNHGAVVYGFSIAIRNALHAKTITLPLLINEGQVGVNDALFNEVEASESSLILECSYTSRLGHEMKETFEVPKDSTKTSFHSDMALIGRQIREDLERIHQTAS